jgi:hypothetical protein
MRWFFLCVYSAADMRGWESSKERLPPGYRLDTSDAASWVLRRPDGTAAARFGVWSASKEGVERVARNDHKRRVSLFRRRIPRSP